MSFASISYTAASALSASQVQIQIAASNIANADTDGYTVKSASMTADNNGTSTSSVTVSGITSSVDKYLLKGLVTALTSYSAASTTADYADSLQTLMGETTSDDDDSGTSLANSIADLETALTTLSGTPESETLQALVVDALDTVATQLRETSSSIQELRSDADSSIEEAVSEVNDALETIADLNEQIALAAAKGESTADLEDQRNIALQTVAENMNISYYTNSDGELIVNTASGTALVSSTGAHEISYSAAAYVTEDTVFAGITVDGEDITDEITSGTIGSLIEVRDETLPAVQDELDELAANLVAEVNAVYASAVSLPADSTITGTTEVTGTDALSLTGTTRIAAVDDDGYVTAYYDFDLSSYATVDDLIADINATGDFTASINADGVLEITATSGDGVVVGDEETGSGLAAYFGLNTIISGTSASDIYVDEDLLSGDADMATATLDMSDTLAVGDLAVTESTSLVNDLISVFTDSTSFDSAGSLDASTTTFADYASDILGQVSTDAETAETKLSSTETTYETLANQMASETGVNTDEETARIEEMQQLYQTAAQILETLNDMFTALLSAVSS